MQAQSPATTGVDEVGQHGRHRCGSWAGCRTTATGSPPRPSSPGTLFFNVSTLAALTHNATAAESDRYVWRPDLFGSVLFLVASAFGILAVSGRFLVVEPRSLPWRIAWVNMLGSVLFMASALASYVLPSTDELLDTRLSVAGTLFGAVVLPRRRRPDVPGLAPGLDPRRPSPPDTRPSVPRRSRMTTLHPVRRRRRPVRQPLRHPGGAEPRRSRTPGMSPVDAMRLVGEDLALEGDPARNLATFVTTWMEPEAQRIIAENLHRNFIDHAEYPRTAEIEQRCIRMLADLFHAPGETTGARTQGSSEAIMLGALSLKWNWRTRREAAGRPDDEPQPRLRRRRARRVGEVLPLLRRRAAHRAAPARASTRSAPTTSRPHVDENTIGVAAVLGTTFTGHKDDIVGINDLLVRIKKERGLDVPLHVDGASGGFVWPFLYPDSPWDFRLEQVRSINVSGHKFGLVYPGIGWLIFREKSDLAPDLVFEENYLGKTDATFTLNFSTGSAMVLAQYYNLVRYGRAGYTYIMQNMQENARVLADKLEAMGRFELIGRDEEQLPLVAFRLAGEERYDEFDIAWQLSAERGWMVPAYTLPPDAQDVTIMRALVKETMSREHVDTLARDIEEACATLARKGGAHESERRQDRHRPRPLTR